MTASAPSLRSRGSTRAAQWGPGLAAPGRQQSLGLEPAGWALRHSQGCGSSRGSPNALGNGVKPARVAGGPARGPKTRMEPGGPSWAGALSQGSAPHFRTGTGRERHRRGLGVLPANSNFIHSTAPSPRCMDPPPQKHSQETPQSLDRLAVPHVNRFAVSRGTWVFFSPFWRR